MTFEYPITKKVDQVDDYHGTKVADPYRWFEDLDSDETKAWVEAQNQLSFGHLDKVEASEVFKKRLTELWDYEKFSQPFKRGGRYFFSHNDGLQNQSVLYTMKSLDDEPRVLLDPNTWSEDGTVALTQMGVSEDGNLLAYYRSHAGSDWQECFVLDIESGKQLDDRLRWINVVSGISWTHDGKGFYYSGYGIPEGFEATLSDETYLQMKPQEALFHKVFYHTLGAPQEQDAVIYERPDDKELFVFGRVSEDGQFLVISYSRGSGRQNGLAFKDLSDHTSPIVDLITEMDAYYRVVGNDGPVFWVSTDLDATRGRLVQIDTRKPERSNWKEIIPQAQETLQGVGLVGEKFVGHYLKDAYTRIAIFDLEGNHERDVELPGIGSAGGFGGKREETETFYTFQSFTYPPSIFRYDMATGETSLWKRPKIDFDFDAFETKQVFFTSKDGTRIPMFITGRKGWKADGNNAVFMTGYGGFGISLTPVFSISNLVWMERGGLVARPNLRGGSEYGTEWHRGGMLKNKQNVFDDFISAAEWLIDNKYTTSQRLCIAGGSNGGLLVGACLTQRPDLFGAVNVAVGVLDMLRFDEFTVGWAWISDYGRKEDPEDFKAMFAYSPLNNVKPGTSYPPTLITTGDHDDRVWPSHSFKFAAALQEAQSGSAPILLRVETRAGHGAGKPTWMTIEEMADVWGFLASHTDQEAVNK